MFYLDYGLFDEDLCILYRMLSELRLIQYLFHAKYLYRLYVCRQTESEIGWKVSVFEKDDDLWMVWMMIIHLLFLGKEEKELY